MNHLLYDLLYTILSPAFGTLVFLDMAIVLWSLHPMDLDTALKQISAMLVNIWSIDVDDLIPVFVTTLVGWLVDHAQSKRPATKPYKLEYAYH